MCQNYRVIVFLDIKIFYTAFFLTADNLNILFVLMCTNTMMLLLTYLGF